jgi:5-methyltetrahydrofolate--homocysteine methyltransferase
VTTCQGTPKAGSVREQAARFKDRGDFLKSHAFAALAIETAEACAEWVHQKLRAAWGFPDDAGVKMQDLFSARYRGKRYSFGYPACPRLDDQALLWRILDPEKHVGVALTEGFMMDPEASVSALVFSHPQAAYFAVSSDAA